MMSKTHQMYSRILQQVDESAVPLDILIATTDPRREIDLLSAIRPGLLHTRPGRSDTWLLAERGSRIRFTTNETLKRHADALLGSRFDLVYFTDPDEHTEQVVAEKVRPSMKPKKRKEIYIGSAL